MTAPIHAYSSSLWRIPYLYIKRYLSLASPSLCSDNNVFTSHLLLDLWNTIFTLTASCWGRSWLRSFVNISDPSGLWPTDIQKDSGVKLGYALALFPQQSSYTSQVSGFQVRELDSSYSWTFQKDTDNATSNTQRCNEPNSTSVNSFIKINSPFTNNINKIHDSKSYFWM